MIEALPAGALARVQRRRATAQIDVPLLGGGRRSAPQSITEDVATIRACAILEPELARAAALDATADGHDPHHGATITAAPPGRGVCR